MPCEELRVDSRPAEVHDQDEVLPQSRHLVRAQAELGDTVRDRPESSRIAMMSVLLGYHESAIGLDQPVVLPG